jgi:hypothetical protein
MGKKGVSRKAIVKSAMSRPKLGEDELDTSTVVASGPEGVSKDSIAADSSVPADPPATSAIIEDKSAKFLIDTNEPNDIDNLQPLSSALPERFVHGQQENARGISESKSQLAQRHKRVNIFLSGVLLTGLVPSFGDKLFDEFQSTRHVVFALPLSCQSWVWLPSLGKAMVPCAQEIKALKEQVKKLGKKKKVFLPLGRVRRTG